MFMYRYSFSFSLVSQYAIVVHSSATNAMSVCYFLSIRILSFCSSSLRCLVAGVVSSPTFSCAVLPPCSTMKGAREPVLSHRSVRISCECCCMGGVRMKTAQTFSFRSIHAPKQPLMVSGALVNAFLQFPFAFGALRPSLSV